MKHPFLMVVLLFSVFSQHSIAQEAPATPEKYTAHNKGKFYIFWGGNRESYSKSDINFSGQDYNFTIHDVEAHDRPKGWHIDYVNPARMTIPQTNFRLGYFITDKYNISVGVDHMKYIMTQDQTVNMNGYINMPASEPGSAFNGMYSNVPQTMTEDFLTFEHTDGLNYVNTEFSRVDDISKLFSIGNTDKFQVNITEGIGGGVLYPKTNAKVLGKQRHDDFHISGYGVAAKVGLNLTFFKYFFMQAELKGGYINMNDIRTTYVGADRAQQEFFFLQRIVSFGGIFRI
ncbi:hypothetical protein LZZ90_13220 [Flavobacterium sp. SM15]|uniref:hypothetical protein n=1 Tax=Flavobacterium sp. SM15 TaxID=2908005 RepID=UPI001EDA7BF2|nr:hypothetical protein [Flavobacterium sp. SM15]MCG2612469.1 hypothetical protein [Flavobacterium sp. SM15]